MGQLHRLDFRCQILHGFARAPLEKVTWLIACERNLSPERKHVWSKTLLHGAVEIREILLAGGKNVIDRIEPRQEDSLKFGDFMRCHVDSM